jgi:hypothetical protein
MTDRDAAAHREPWAHVEGDRGPSSQLPIRIGLAATLRHPPQMNWHKLFDNKHLELTGPRGL